MVKKPLQWLQFWNALRVFLRAAIHPNTPLPAKLLLIGAMAYVVIPFDIVPDVLPLLGQADDILALIIAGMTFLHMTHSVREKLRTPQK